MTKRNILAIAAAAISSWMPISGSAQQALSVDDIAQVTVLSGWRMNNGTHMAAIRINLAGGWKTYWRAPGEAGIPPSFSWGGSKNLSSVRLQWPTPKVFHQNGLQTIGYDTEVVIPMELTPTRPGGEAITLRGRMELGVCEDVCIPVSVQLDADLSAPGEMDTIIRTSLTDRPATAKEAGVGKVICHVEPISDGLRLTTHIDLPRMANKEVAVVEIPDQTIWVARGTTKRNGGELVVTTDLVPANAAPFLLDRSDVRITVLGNGEAVDIRGCTGS